MNPDMFVLVHAGVVCVSIPAVTGMNKHDKAQFSILPR